MSESDQSGAPTESQTPPAGEPQGQPASQAPEPSHEAPPNDEPTDSTDWKTEARKHEGRAKANRAAAEKAEADRTAAEAARQDSETKQREFQDGLAKLLGYKQEDAPPDPAALQQTVAEREQTIASRDGRIGELESAVRERDVELAAWRSASRLGARVSDLLDRRSFVTAISSLDHSSETFAADLDAAVKAALVSDPTLRINATPAPGAAGIGSKGADERIAVAPGAARMRAAYSTT